MYNFNNYDNQVESMRHISNESRNSERMAEVNRSVGGMRSDFMKVKIMLQATMELMVESGIDPERINAKIAEVADRPETFAPSKQDVMPCPKCGRQIPDNGKDPLVGTCLYCGETVKFIPEFKMGNGD